MIYFQLFCSFLQVGLFSIGGGYAAMPLIKSEIVTGHGWLTMNEFADLITIAEMTPGPIAVNAATFVGIRIGGIPGAIAATLGCILPSCIIVSLLSFIYRKYKNLTALQGVLAALRPAVVALIAAAGLSLLETVAFQHNARGADRLNLTGVIIFLCAFAILRKFKWNPIIVMGLCGAAGLLAGLAAGV